VLADRLGEEYGLPVAFDVAPCDTARWISSADPAALAKFISAHRPEIATDLDGDHVYLAPSAFALSWTQEKNPDIAFTDIKTIDRA
jgi:peptide chain release factor 3